VIDLPGGVKIGGKEVILMAGPCTIENREQVEAIAPLVRQRGRQSDARRSLQTTNIPVCVSRHGRSGLRYLRDAASKNGLLVVM